METYAALFDAIPVFWNALFTWDMLFALLFGIIGGMIIGALPGLSATMGVALLIPFTYGMKPIPALTMLCAIYTSAIMGGSFSAIMIHTPGTPASAATLLDGYPMAQQGYPKRALGIAVYSSVVGGTLSVLVLLLVAPPLARFTLKFSAPEYFLLGFFGISIIASLSEGAMAKGICSGLLGILISTIGTDVLTSFPRFTYGSPFLRGGIKGVPVMIGLFSIAQVMIQAIKSKETLTAEILSLKEKKDGPKDGIFLSIKDFCRMFPTMLVSSVIGIWVGILPGAGGDIAGWLAYNEVRRASKNKEKFGTGYDLGIVASESANNAVTGGGLIPLLTLGIPGTSTAAVLLGALTIQGLLPGADLFTKQANITYSFIFGFLLASICMSIFGFIACKYAAYLSKVPIRVLNPIIVVLSVIGAYAYGGIIDNLYVMLIFGFLGYFMRKSGFNAAALILGLILGGMTEQGFRRALVMSRGNYFTYFFSRPLSLFLLFFIILTLMWPFVSRYLKKKKSLSV